MANLLMITSFDESQPTRITIAIDKIVAIAGFGSGLNSGTELEMVTGSIYRTSIWDTDWPTILRLAAAHDGPLYVYDRRDNMGHAPAIVQTELDADKAQLFGIKPRGHQSSGQTRAKVNARRNTRSGSRRRPTEDVGGRGTPCAMCENEVTADALVELTDADDETMLVCQSCHDAYIEATDGATVEA